MLSTSGAIAKSIPSQSLETNAPISPSSQLYVGQHLCRPASSPNRARSGVAAAPESEPQLPPCLLKFMGISCHRAAHRSIDRPLRCRGSQLLNHRIDPQRRQCGIACNTHVALIPGVQALVFCVSSPRPMPVGTHCRTGECTQALLSMARASGKQTHQVASTHHGNFLACDRQKEAQY